MFNVLRTFLTFEIPSDRVTEVRAESFIQREILYREDGLLLYMPPTKNDNKAQYEILLHRPNTEVVYSLFRTVSKEEAEMRFINYKDKISAFIDVNKEMCTTSGLQKLCDILMKHPSWTLAHLAAYFDRATSFTNPSFNTHINSSDPETGMSPIQVAIEALNLACVESLIQANCSLDHLDVNKNSVFHFASNTNKEIIMMLSKKSTTCLNTRNNIGYTPLHLACMADKRDCVNALLLSGADVNVPCSVSKDSPPSEPGIVHDFIESHQKQLYHHDMKYGGTPLHWSCSREVIEILIAKKCNVDALNFEERTALHLMVLRNRLECIVALLSNGADVNICDVDGNTSLHLAVKEGNPSIIQALIVFGANMAILNKKGATPRHLVTNELAPKILYYLHASGAPRCEKGVSGCTEGCIYNGSYGGIPPPPIIGPINRDILNGILSVHAMDLCSQKSGGQRPEGGRLLCLDGGGIRGLILAQMLLELEKIVNQPIISCFDWIAGTSTGGILALALASGKSLYEILCLYFRLKEHTFIGKRPYPSEALESVLKECFGPTTVMTDIKEPKIMITGVLADRKPADLHLFRNYQSPVEILKVEQNTPYQVPLPPEKQLLWQVGRATGAAPSYFRAFDNYLDGGLMSNNPTLDAITEIHEYNLSLRAVNRENEILPLKVVVSLGTGVIPVTSQKEIDVFRPESIWDSTKLVLGISAIGTLLVDQATLADGRVVDRARAWCSMIGVPYYRFSPQISEDITMDEKSDEKLVKMLWESKVYMLQHVDSMKELAVLLTN